MTNCNWRFDFIDYHKHEYWYTCTTCGIDEWFAYYDKPVDGKPGIRCKEKKKEG